jgi:hypothetical protein
MPAPVGRPPARYAVPLSVFRALTPLPPPATVTLTEKDPAGKSSLENARWLCENYAGSVRGLGECGLAAHPTPRVEDAGSPVPSRPLPPPPARRHRGSPMFYPPQPVRARARARARK